MAEFVVEYAVLRWTVVGAFVVAASVVLSGLLILPSRHPEPPAASEPASGAVPHSGSGTGASTEKLAAPLASVVALDHESDAAHLIMCAVMLVMLVFPLRANMHALHGVLTAMVVVFAALLVDRLLRCYLTGGARSSKPMVVLIYHLAAATAMLYAMTGHGVADDSGGPAPVVLYGLAVLFTVDSAVMFLAAHRVNSASPGRWRRAFAHLGGVPNIRHARLSLVPHLVMDLGTAYMLIAAAA